MSSKRDNYDDNRTSRDSLFGVDDIRPPPSLIRAQIFSPPSIDAIRKPQVQKSNSTNRGSVRVPERERVVFKEEDPLSKSPVPPSDVPEGVLKTENLTIRLDDEIRIVSAMQLAAKKQTTGSIYSVKVDISKKGSLGVGVKDLSDSILAISLLKRENGALGPGESAGLRLGDVVFGINFIPTREGSRTLIRVIKREIEKGRKVLYVQGWRCHQLCSDPVQGNLFPRADDVLVQAYSLFRTKVFSDWERWNFIEILLGHMVEDLKIRSKIESGRKLSNHEKRLKQVLAGENPPEKDISAEDGNQSPSDGDDWLRDKQMQLIDLERNILQAKGLRTALCVRIVYTKTQGETVIYVLRVEDVETGLQWVVNRRYRDFYALKEELMDISQFAKEIEFPRKRIALNNLAKIIEMRIVALEHYIRKILQLFTVYATMDSSASRSLRHIQNFLGVDKYVDCIHPPPLDDQRYIELMAYRFLNELSSPACQQCNRFVMSIDLDSMIERGPHGYLPVLEHVRAALTEVEQFVIQQHQQQMIQSLKERRPDATQEQLRSFVRKCVRRQVEASLFLPLRRTIFRIVYSFLAVKSKALHKSMTLLQQASPAFFEVDEFIPRSATLPLTIKAFRRVIQAYLPADQGQLLVEAAHCVLALHRECEAENFRRMKIDSVKDASSKLNEGIILAQNSSRSSRERRSDHLTPRTLVNETKIAGRPSSMKGLRDFFSRSQSGDISTIPKFNEDIPGNSPGNRTSFRPSRLLSRSKSDRSSIINAIMRKPTSDAADGSGTDFTSQAVMRDPAGKIFTPDDSFSVSANIFNDMQAHEMDEGCDRNAVEDTEQLSLEDPSDSDRVSFSVDGTKLLKDQPTAGSGLYASYHSKDFILNYKEPSSDDGVSPTISTTDLTGFYPETNSPKSEAAQSEVISLNELCLEDLERSQAQLDEKIKREEQIALKNKELLERLLYDDVPFFDRPVSNHEESESLGDRFSMLRSGSNLFADGDKYNIDLLPKSQDYSAHLPPLDGKGYSTVRNIDRTSTIDSGIASSDGNLADRISGIALTSRQENHNERSDVLSQGTLEKSAQEFRTQSLSNGVANTATAQPSSPSSKRRMSNSMMKVTVDPLTNPDSFENEYSAIEVNNDGPRLSGSNRSRNQSIDFSAGKDYGKDRNVSDASVLINNSVNPTGEQQQSVLSADSFLPLFTYALVQADLPQLLLVKELMVALVDDEDTYGECGYYLATMEAATQHILDMSQQFEDLGKFDQMFDDEQENLLF